MKNVLHLLYLLLSFITVSCATEDEDEEQLSVPQLRLTKASTFFAGVNEPFMTYQYTYNEKGLMTDFMTQYKRVRHSYDHDKRLVSAVDEITEPYPTPKITEAFSYNTAGWLATASLQYYRKTPATHLLQLHFSMMHRAESYG